MMMTVRHPHPVSPKHPWAVFEEEVRLVRAMFIIVNLAFEKVGKFSSHIGRFLWRILDA